MAVRGSELATWAAPPLLGRARRASPWNGERWTREHPERPLSRVAEEKSSLKLVKCARWVGRAFSGSIKLNVGERVFARMGGEG